MGQKMHPHGLRVGIIKDWDSKWFANKKEYAENLYTEADFKEAKKKYDYCTPFTKESLLYRDIFEKYYPNKSKWIKDFWMPNKEWQGCNVDDPSARVLSNYGDSGI